MKLLTEDFLNRSDIDYTNDSIIEDVNEIENIDIVYNLLEIQSEFNNSYQNILQEEYKNIKNNDLSSKLNDAIVDLIRKFQRKNNLELHKFIKSFKNRIVQDKEDIYPYLEKLKSYDGENIEIDEVRYNYTHIFKNQLPPQESLNDFIDIKIDIDKAINKDKSITNYERLELLKEEYKNLIEYISSGKCYSETRAKCLGRNGQISAENFSEELFKVFRDGSNAISGPVTKSEVIKTAKRFPKYESLIDDILKEKNTVWKQYNYIINNLNSIDIKYTSDWFGNSRSEFDKFYKLYIKLKINQAIYMNNIYTRVYFEKLQNIAKSYLQDRNILIKACGEISAIDSEINESFIEDYNMFLIEEQFNAVETYLEMMEANGIIELSINESTVISLNEAKFDNLKNFLINICKKLSEAMDRFIGRLGDLTKLDQKFLDDNMKIITSDEIIKNEATISNYYSYKDLMNKLAAVSFKATTSGEITAKAEAGQWQTPEDYLKQGGATGINGFTYDANKGSIKEQIEDYLRSTKQDISSNAINRTIRSNLVGYCKNDFPQIKKLIDADRAALKTFGQAMDSYIATSSSNSEQQTTATVQQSVSVNPSTQETNAAFSYEDTMMHYFNEVEINDKTPNNTPGNQAEVNKNNEKAEANVKKDKDKAISNATKSYIKVNTQKMSAKMNIAIEAYRQCMKILKWYVKEYKKQNGEQNKKEKETNNTNNKGTISDAI